MDFIIEIICELFLCVISVIFEDKKVSKWVRYPFIGIIFILYTFIIGVLIWAGIIGLQKDIIKPVVFFGLSAILLLSGIMSIRRICEKKDDF
ncbi:hypothetical protein [Anaerofustis stercorihominis]|uniref:hypothetical protein n=1 Tax=Anaerofustis stercorihominis TaxID=214853 RepID=UPI0011070715|nr:hypothetical protein [Anaerofustis stercorihominis]